MKIIITFTYHHHSFAVAKMHALPVVKVVLLLCNVHCKHFKTTSFLGIPGIRFIISATCTSVRLVDRADKRNISDIFLQLKFHVFSTCRPLADDSSWLVGWLKIWCTHSCDSAPLFNYFLIIRHHSLLFSNNIINVKNMHPHRNSNPGP